jgi:YfiH family protein
MSFPADWIVPDWPVPPNVRAVCTTRVGGASAAPYDSLNLGDHVGDDPSAVATNRRVFADATGARPVFLKQVHGTDVEWLGADTADGTEADGCLTSERGLACTIMVADCLPVLFATKRGSAVAAAHAGWRGLAGRSGQGVLEAVATALLIEAGAGEVIAWLGPCIGPEAFEVGPEVKAAFEAHDPQSASLFKSCQEGKWFADLPGLARRKLQSLGITSIHGNDGGREWCTVSNPSRFFSHRRDHISGRLAASVWLT